MEHRNHHTEDDFHQKQAVQCFNRTWEVLSKGDLTQEVLEEALNQAHASFHHWQQIGQPIHFKRGNWLLCYVNALAGNGHSALHYARETLRLTEENGFQDFDMAYAYEAMARANYVLGNTDEYQRYYQLAEEAGEQIEKEGDRKLFFSDLESITSNECRP